MLPSIFSIFALLGAPNVVLISVDTLRADHLGCYGYIRPTSPNIDRLADGSLLFEDCICEEPQTTPSMCSMFSAQIPRVTGCVRNAVPLPEGIVTVAQVFRDAGYQTAAVVSNWNLKRELCGLDRGFDNYDDAFGRPHLGLTHPERYADEVTELALGIVGQRAADRPFFFWFHYMDPHAPYRYHRAFNPWRKTMRELEERDETIARYDSEVAFADHHIGRLLEALPKSETFVVFTADHGESLFEHGILGHSRDIYQPGLRIPLLVRGPGIRPGRTAAPARGIDIGVTLLGLAGLQAAPEMLGIDLIAAKPAQDRVRVVEVYGGGVREGADAREVVLGRIPKFQGVIVEGWKLVTDGSNPELFHIESDPLETRDLADAKPEPVRALCGRLEQWSAETPRGAAEAAPLTEDDIRALDAAGYL